MSFNCYGCGGCVNENGLTVTAKGLREHQMRAGCNVKLEELDEARTALYCKAAHDNKIGTCACGAIVSIRVDGAVHGGHVKMCKAPCTRTFTLGQDGKPNGKYVDTPKSSAAAASAAATTGNRKSAAKRNIGASGASGAAAASLPERFEELKPYSRPTAQNMPTAAE